MKKSISIIFAAILIINVFFTVPIVGSAATVDDLKFHLKPDGKSYIVTGAKVENIGDLAIPSSYNNLPVSGIHDYAFYNRSDITSVTIPNSVKSISFSAFENCTKIKSINIPNSVTSIGHNAFSGCTALASITLPAGLTRVESGIVYNTAFYNNTANWINGCLYIGNYLIKMNAPGTIKAGVTVIADGAASMCTGLTKIVIPDSVQVIGESAFYGCEALSSVKFGSKVKTIGPSAFENCSSLTEIVLPASVADIGNYAFRGCYRLVSFSAGNGLKKIGRSAFEGCTNLKTINLPNSGIEIYEKAFYNTDLYNNYSKWENDILYIGNHLIESKSTWASTLSTKNGTKSIAAHAFSGHENLMSFDITEGVAIIGTEAFRSCLQLNKITIPSSVTSIGYYAFFGCPNMSVKYNGSTAQWKKINIDDGNSALKNITYVVPAPKVSSASVINGVKVTWTAVAGATKYVVFRRTAGSSVWENLGTTTALSFVDKKVKSGTYYRYSVRAYFEDGTYTPYDSSKTSLRKYMATPKITTIYNHKNGLAIKWNTVAGVTNGYRVYRRGAATTVWTYLGTTKNAYWIDSGVKNSNGNYYRYTVIADGGYRSDFDTAGPYLKRLANPKLTSAVSAQNGITVKWSAIKGTTGYYVYRKTSSSTWVCLGSSKGTNNTSFIDKTAKKGVTYTYTVRACYGYTLSSYDSGINCYDKY